MKRLSICLLGFLAITGLTKADSFPSSSLDPADVIAAKPGITIYKTKAKAWHDGKFGVNIPASYNPSQPMPLVVSAHGHGGDGAGEANAWRNLADKYHFIVVTPSYETSAFLTDDNVAEDNKMLIEVMTRVFGSLNIDRRRVLHTGFSGGGLGTWHVAAAKHDDWFTALCFRSSNYFADPPIRFNHWRERPIYMMWGTNDLPGIADQGATMLKFVQKEIHNNKVKSEVIQGGHHDSHPEKVAQWFAGLTDADLEPPDPDAPIHL